MVSRGVNVLAEYANTHVTLLVRESQYTKLKPASFKTIYKRWERKCAAATTHAHVG